VQHRAHSRGWRHWIAREQVTRRSPGSGINDFRREPCSGSLIAKQKLQELFPNWGFQYRAADSERQTGLFQNCPLEIVDDLSHPANATPALGHGMAVALGADFYVLAPSAPMLARGVFEQSDTLRLALTYRDRVNQAIIDNDMITVIKSLKDDRGNAISEDSVRDLAFGVVNEGWGWQARERPN